MQNLNFVKFLQSCKETNRRMWWRCVGSFVYWVRLRALVYLNNAIFPCDLFSSIFSFTSEQPIWIYSQLHLLKLYCNVFISLIICCVKMHFGWDCCLCAVHERLLRTSDDFACLIDINIQGRFVIDVEFLDLKICPLNVRFYLCFNQNLYLRRTLVKFCQILCCIACQYESWHIDFLRLKNVLWDITFWCPNVSF